MENIHPNPVLEGKKPGNPVFVRGDFTKITLWNALMSLSEPVQTLELVELTKLSYEQVKSWLDAWAKAGYITKEALGKSPTGGKRFVFSVIKASKMPPQIDLKGIYQEPEHRNYVWEAIRFINTSNDIVFEIETVLEYIKEHYDIDVSYTYAQSYLYSLYRAGYFKSYHEGVRREPAYSLLHDTGPLAPSIRRGKTVFDANLGVIVND